MKLSAEELADVMSRGGRQNPKRASNNAEHKNNSARGVPDVEQYFVNVAKESHATENTLPRVVIRFTHYRRRLADVDNFATKYFVDALVKSGILRNDSPKEVEEVRHRQVKIETWEEESIDIELFEAGGAL